MDKICKGLTTMIIILSGIVEHVGLNGQFGALKCISPLKCINEKSNNRTI